MTQRSRDPSLALAWLRFSRLRVRAGMTYGGELPARRGGRSIGRAPARSGNHARTHACVRARVKHSPAAAHRIRHHPLY
jgi:hypothetical protein